MLGLIAISSLRREKEIFRFESKMILVRVKKFQFFNFNITAIELRVHQSISEIFKNFIKGESHFENNDYIVISYFPRFKLNREG